MSSPWGSTVPSGEPSSQGQKQDLVLGFRGNEKEIIVLHARTH
jgi:hypothetical protein